MKQPPNSTPPDLRQGPTSFVPCFRLVGRELLWTGRDDPWQVQAPFVFWLLEMLRPRTIVDLTDGQGVSFGAFCQGTAELGLGASCQAVIEGGERLSPGQMALMEHCRSSFGNGFPIIKSGFDQAAKLFEDSSVDLLHLDSGRDQAYLAEVLSRFQPKLGPRSLLLIHGVEEKRGRLGSIRLFTELSRRHPSFSLLSGLGLGLVGVGESLPPELAPLWRLPSDQQDGFREIFTRLGLSQKNRDELGAARARSQELSNKRESLVQLTEKQKELLSGARSELQDLADRLMALTEEAEGLREEADRLKEESREIRRDLAKARAEAQPGRSPGRKRRPGAFAASALFGLFKGLSPPRGVPGRLDRLLYRSISFSPAPLGRRLAVYLTDRSGLFDSGYYMERNPDVALAGALPLNHYALHGAFEGRKPNHLFDSYYYLKQHPEAGENGLNPLVHYFVKGAAEGLDPGPNFSTGFQHLEEAQEGKTGLNPLAQRLELLAKIDPLNLTEPSRGLVLRESTPYLSDHAPRLILVSHEASRTGAPLILLNIVRHLAQRHGFECFVLTMRSGPLLTEFHRFAHVADLELVSDKTAFVEGLLLHLEANPPQAAILNTAESIHLAGPFQDRGTPILSLVHELATSYTPAHFKNIFSLSQKVVFPSRFCRRSALKAADPPRDKAVVLSQGLLDDEFGSGDRPSARKEVVLELGLPEDAFMVLGCGTQDLRKGLDLFTQLALASLRGPLGETRAHFVWLGGVRPNLFPPHSPARYCLRDIAAAGLEDRVHFIGSRDRVENYFLAADAFVMVSREDPFPCVVLEAMAAGLPVLAFEGAGGAPEALAEEAGMVLPYGDIGAMAGALRQLHQDRDFRAVLGWKARNRVLKEYRFGDYADRLVELLVRELRVGPASREGPAPEKEKPEPGPGETPSPS